MVPPTEMSDILIIPFHLFEFAPVIQLPPIYDIYDFTGGYDPNRQPTNPYGIGRYNEVRPSMYVSDLFKKQSEPRNIHVGIDIAAPAGEAVHAFADSRVHLSAINPAEGDYGGTVILEMNLKRQSETYLFWALFGHLSHHSVSENRPGRWLKKGEAFASVGAREENGGWNPHLHFQLSMICPQICDLPGAVTASGRNDALKIYPDPRLVLGPLY